MKSIKMMLLLGASLLALAAFAQQGPPAGHGEGHGHGTGMGMQGMTAEQHLQMMAEKLGLTDDQKAKIKPILESHHQDMQKLMADKSLSKDDRMAKMKSLHEDVMAKVKPILTDEQKKKLDDMHQGMMQGHGDHGKGHDHGGMNCGNPK